MFKVCFILRRRDFKRVVGVGWGGEGKRGGRESERQEEGEEDTHEFQNRSQLSVEERALGRGKRRGRGREEEREEGVVSERERESEEGLNFWVSPARL